MEYLIPNVPRKEFDAWEKEFGTSIHRRDYNCLMDTNEMKIKIYMMNGDIITFITHDEKDSEEGEKMYEEAYREYEESGDLDFAGSVRKKVEKGEFLNCADIAYCFGKI